MADEMNEHQIKMIEEKNKEKNINYIIKLMKSKTLNRYMKEM